MKLSVWMITYNHAPFIREAIESVLMQQTNFDFELVIGDDCSKDETREILESYKNKYPNQIKLLLHPKNLGMMGNMIATLEACTGTYIAMCEGDDYWIDPLKLQKQVDFLDQNPDHVLTFHNALLQFDEEPERQAEIFYSYTKEDYTIEDLFGDWFIPTASVVFRNYLIPSYPDWFKASPTGDTPLFTMIALYGKIKLLPGVLSVYRHHVGGVTKSIVNYSFWERLYKVYDALDHYTHYKYSKNIRTMKSSIYYNLAQAALIKKDKGQLRLSVYKLLRLRPKNLFAIKYFKISVIALAPKLYYLAKSV